MKQSNIHGNKRHLALSVEALRGINSNILWLIKTGIDDTTITFVQKNKTRILQMSALTRIGLGIALRLTKKLCFLFYFRYISKILL